MLLGQKTESGFLQPAVALRKRHVPFNDAGGLTIQLEDIIRYARPLHSDPSTQMELEPAQVFHSSNGAATQPSARSRPEL